MPATPSDPGPDATRLPDPGPDPEPKRPGLDGPRIVADAAGVSEVVERLFRDQAGRLVATLTGRFGVDKVGLAEDVVQEALARALKRWPFTGVPDEPAAWITTVAKNLALDILRRETRGHTIGDPNTLEALFDATPAAAVMEAQRQRQLEERTERAFDPDHVVDDRLRMMFVCAHPGIPSDARIALILKTLAGFGIAEIARAQMTREETVHKRLVRARARLRELGLSFEIPTDEQFGPCLADVLHAIHLIFNEGHAAHQGDTHIRLDLVEEALRLATELRNHPRLEGHLHKSAVDASLATMWLVAARLPSRVSEAGEILVLAEQDRSRWDPRAIARGVHYLGAAMQSDHLTTGHLEAQIAATHTLAASIDQTDWNVIRTAYDTWMELAPSPVVALNQSVAIGMTDGPAAGLAALHAIAPSTALRDYHHRDATEGFFHERLGQADQAIAAFLRALDHCTSGPERSLLLRRLDRLDADVPPALRHGFRRLSGTPAALPRPALPNPAPHPADTNGNVPGAKSVPGSGLPPPPP